VFLYASPSRAFQKLPYIMPYTPLSEAKFGKCESLLVRYGFSSSAQRMVQALFRLCGN